MHVEMAVVVDQLSDNPSRSTTARIMEKPIEYLISFAEEQGVELEEVIYILQDRCSTRRKKKEKSKGFHSKR